MNLTATGATYLGFFAMFLGWVMRIIAIYAMYMVIKALKIYIKKNS